MVGVVGTSYRLVFSIAARQFAIHSDKIFWRDSSVAPSSKNKFGFRIKMLRDVSTDHEVGCVRPAPSELDSNDHAITHGGQHAAYAQPVKCKNESKKQNQNAMF